MQRGRKFICVILSFNIYLIILTPEIIIYKKNQQLSQNLSQMDTGKLISFITKEKFITKRYMAER